MRLARAITGLALAAGLLAAALPALAAAPASAAPAAEAPASPPTGGVEVAAAAATPGAVARTGAYLPLGLRATNRTGRTIAEVRVTTGGPVAVTVPWEIAPGEESGCFLPVFCTGADLAATLEFRDASGRTVARAATGPVEVRPAADGCGFIGIATGLGAREPDAAAIEALGRALGADTARPLYLGPEPLALLWRSGMLDAVVTGDARAAAFGRAAVVPAGWTGSPLAAAPLPAGTLQMIQPRAYRLFASDPWPAEDQRRLWLWLGLLALAVLVVGAIVPRRRRVAAALAVAALGLAAGGALRLFGDLRRARTVEARVFYVRPGTARCGLEHFAYLESRGGATAWFRPSAAAATPIPVPVLASSQDLFGPLVELDVAGDDAVATRRPRALVRILTTAPAPPFGYAARGTGREDLEAMARRPDLVAALRVEGARGTDAAGLSQTLDAWAVTWQGDADANLAYAGRSLAWWNADRREGDAPVLVAWWRDAPAAPSGPASARAAANPRLPALVVYGGPTEPM
ncbi:MAG: hypothetical protein IMZ66_05365 [Planctomycetes bacterium]|nr:hypothetical protein [Planctomycetota bacterium]